MSLKIDEITDSIFHEVLHLHSSSLITCHDCNSHRVLFFNLHFFADHANHLKITVSDNGSHLSFTRGRYVRIRRRVFIDIDLVKQSLVDFISRFTEVNEHFIKAIKSWLFASLILKLASIDSQVPIFFHQDCSLLDFFSHFSPKKDLRNLIEELSIIIRQWINKRL